MKTYAITRQTNTTMLEILLLLAAISFISIAGTRKTELFTKNWRFVLGDTLNGQQPGLNDSHWRVLDLPHDWSIVKQFDSTRPVTAACNEQSHDNPVK